MTLAEMDNIVEMDSRIISQCFQSLWFFFFFKELLGGFLAKQLTATACRLPESFQTLSSLCYIDFFFFNFWFPLWITNMISHLPLPLIPSFLGNYVLSLSHRQTDHPLPDFSGLGMENRRSWSRELKTYLYQPSEQVKGDDFPYFL